jgi:hypothetical protein
MIKMVTTFFSKVFDKIGRVGSRIRSYELLFRSDGQFKYGFFGSGRTILLFNGRPVFQWFRCTNAYSVNYL